MSIYEALIAQLQTVPGLPRQQLTNQPLIQPKANEQWVRPTLLRAESTTGAIGRDGYLIEQGTLQIDLFTPKGSGDASALLADIRAAFNERGSSLSVDGRQLRITKAWIGNAIEDGAWFKTSVYVRWERNER
ncbi:phage tail terminator-like protein [Acidovorax sp.]|uniref:phage tail terminator-like protein n=1 Tax=Acidovorax sp. TaxID=1872122 RepID=UPI00391F150F